MKIRARLLNFNVSLNYLKERDWTKLVESFKYSINNLRAEEAALRKQFPPS